MGDIGVRQAAMSIWEIVQLSRQRALLHDGSANRWTWRTIQSWVSYALDHWSRKKRTPMDVNEMVKNWLPIVRSLAVAHSKEEFDRAEFEAETHLAPLLTAPVAQLREFYSLLCDAIREDERIPFFVSASFDAWHEVVLKKAPDEAVKELKTALASEVAELVEEDILPDFRQALVGALQWRSASSLERIRDAVKAGHKPSLRGRESCLFLLAGDECVMV